MHQSLNLHKIDGTTIDDAKDLDMLMLTYDLSECILNCSDTAGSLWLYSKDEAINFNANIVSIKYIYTNSLSFSSIFQV